MSSNFFRIIFLISSFQAVDLDFLNSLKFDFSEELMSKFPNRNLVALSVYPLYVYPTHYVGDSGYVSDTEGTVTVYQTENDPNNNSDNATADNTNDSPEAIAERRFQQRKITSRLQGDL